MGTALHSTLSKMQKLEETGSHMTNGVLKAKLKQQRDKIKTFKDQTDDFPEQSSIDIGLTQNSIQSTISKDSKLSELTALTGRGRDLSAIIRNQHPRKQEKIFDSFTPNKFPQ
jgi:hypothetical protein